MAIRSLAARRAAYAGGTRFHFAPQEQNRGVAAIHLAANKSPLDCCIESFESLPCGARNKQEGYPFGYPSCLFGTPEGTRTPDLLIRSQSLYPTELPAHARIA